MFEAGVFDLFFFPGGSPADLLSQYTQLTSKPYLPPFFSLGYHQSRWNYLDENGDFYLTKNINNGILIYKEISFGIIR